MKIGVERYGHGVLLGMAEEELLDDIMYINSDYQRKSDPSTCSLVK